MRKIFSLVLAVLAFVPFTLAPLVMQGCGREVATVAPQMTLEPETPRGTALVLPVEYSGNESEEDVLRTFDELGARGFTLTPEDREMALAAFRAEHDSQVNESRPIAPAEPLASYSAYASHYEPGAGDMDLWLEYKWWTGGSRQSYHFETPIWSIYWIIRIRYGGSLTNWTWMEGSYQRVTAVVGSALYVPYSDAFLRQYIRVVT